ncbi:hypothetical protein GCK32_009274 [Trichostrongylus colubriformis]|uniref:Uncharacterized protein n=1 Tax=Trichostrongylus colubriformis TaxID=6319 RepID=A0AAN8FPH3_TRICO
MHRKERPFAPRKVAGEIERLVPVIREACATAGESIRVCSVFTHWCQQLGDQIRIEGLTGTQLMNAIEELKEDFYRNRMEGHWLLPSISPLLSLTAHELEKSRENSLIAETQTGESSMSSAGDKNIFKAAAELSGGNSSRLLNNEQLEKEDKNDKCGPSVEKHDDESEKSVDRLLEEAEKKSAQLENQLNALQRKISESKNVDESTHIRLYQLLHRLNTSASSILIVDGGDAVEEPVHKQSAASVMSLNITADDIHHGRRVFAGEEAVAPSSKQENLPDESTLTGQQNVPRLQLNGNREASRDDADNDSHYSYENDFDDELYQFYCDSSRHLGWPTKLLVQFSQTCAVVVNGELLSDVIKCSRTLLNEHMNGVPEESKSSGKGGNRYTKEAGVNESEAHSQLMGMIQSTIDDEGTPDMENKKQDKAEIGKKPNFEENGDDIEDEIEVRHTNAQEGANNGSSSTPDKAGTESIENSDAQQNQTSAGIDDPQNGIGAHPESPSGSDQPSSHVSAVASARDTEETGGGVDENENENSGRTFSPTTPTAEDGRQNDEAETKSGEETPSSSTPITENGDQNLDGAEMKSSKETPSPSTPIAEEGGHQMDGTGARKGEVNLSLNNPIAKEEDEAEMKSDEGTPLSSSRTTERGDQRQDGAELKCEKRIPSLSTPTVEFANQNSDEGEIKSDEGRTPSSSTPTPDEGDQMEHRDESKEKDGQAISLRAPTGEEDDQNLDGAEIEESNDSTPSTGTPSFSETNHKVDRAQTKSVEDDPPHSKPPMPIVMNGDLPSRSESATTASSDIQYPSKASFPRTAQEYELSHKYHIQSHVNTATRTPVIVQAVPLQRNLFRSPTTIRKFASEDIAEKPVLLQPRFVH